MAIELTLSNIFQFISAIAPLILGFFLIMLSVFNQDIKGIIYLAGILISTCISILALNIIRHDKNDDSKNCDIIDLPFTNNFDIPSVNSVLLSFTFIYLVMPMISSNQMNYSLIVFLLGMIAIDAISKIMNKCTNIGGIFVGLLIGGGLGLGWFLLFKSLGFNSVLYFNEANSNKVYCSRPQKQTFKCSVYKNGELIKTV